MLARYTHPTEQRKLAALETFASIVGTSWAQSTAPDALDEHDAAETAPLQGVVGGRQGARTLDLGVANAPTKTK